MKMKRILILFAFAVVAVMQTMAQTSMIDVVYLKNGSVIRGIITEQTPNESLKIKTSDGNLFVYQMGDVERISKEEVVEAPKKSFTEQLREAQREEMKKAVIDRGYVGFAGLDYGYCTGDFNNFLNFGFSTVHGYQINPYIFVGAGLGLYMWGEYRGGYIDLSVPMFFAARFTPLKKPITPFVDMRIGYAAGKVDGLYFNPYVGIRIGIRKSFAAYIGLGYQLQKMEGVKDMKINYDTGKVSYTKTKVNCNAVALRVGFEF